MPIAVPSRFRVRGILFAAGAILLGSLGLDGRAAQAADDAALTLELKDHKFQPLLPVIPAGIRVKVTVKNLDPTPAEFESDDFEAEKVVPAGGEITLFIGPLKPGSYEFHDEYHEDASKTKLTVQ